MKSSDLESIYEALAMAVDATDADKRELLLAKLALLLADDLADAARVKEHIAAACANLDV